MRWSLMPAPKEGGNEAGRKAAEEKREDAEHDRQASEATRESSEDTRQLAEEFRETAEMLRREHEASRQAAEAVRQATEEAPSLVQEAHSDLKALRVEASRMPDELAAVRAMIEVSRQESAEQRSLAEEMCETVREYERRLRRE